MRPAHAGGPVPARMVMLLLAVIGLAEGVLFKST